MTTSPVTSSSPASAGEGLVIPTLWQVVENSRSEDNYRASRPVDYWHYESQADAEAAATKLNDTHGWKYDGYYNCYEYSVESVEIDVISASGLTLEAAKREAQERRGAHIAALHDAERKKLADAEAAVQRQRDAIFRAEAAKRGIEVTS